MSNKLKKILLTIISIIVIGVSYYLITKPKQVDTSGEVTIIVIDETGTKVINEVIPFDEGQTMMDLISEKYDIEVSNGFLIRFEDVYAPNRFEAYIQIFINEVSAQKGLIQLEFKDGDVISFVYTNIG